LASDGPQFAAQVEEIGLRLLLRLEVLGPQMELCLADGQSLDEIREPPRLLDRKSVV
jgi:hypothetical protein